MRGSVGHRLRGSAAARLLGRADYDPRWRQGRLDATLDLVVSRIRGEQHLPTLVRQGLRIGDRSYVASRTRLDPGFPWAITIGSDVVISHDVRVIAHDASMRGAVGYTLVRPVTIGDGAYVGAASIILPGVTIGAHVIVGAGSLVREDAPPETVVAGNPARVIATRAEFLERQKARLDNTRRFEVGPLAENPASADELEQMRDALAAGTIYVK